MGREANGTLQIQLIGNTLNTINGIDGDPKATWGEALDAIKLLTGVEDGQINRVIYKKEIALSSGGVLTLDVFDFAGFDCGGGDGQDQLGQPMAVDEMVLIFVKLKAGSAGQLRVGAEGSGAAWNTPWGCDDAYTPLRATSTLPGFFILFVPSSTGLEVTDVTNHLLKFEAVGGACTFDLLLCGRDNP